MIKIRSYCLQILWFHSILYCSHSHSEIYLKQRNGKKFSLQGKKSGPQGRDPCRMPCRVRKEVWLEPPAGARIRRKKLKLPTPLISKKKSKISVGVICSPSPIVPLKLLIYFFLTILFIFSINLDWVVQTNKVQTCLPIVLIYISSNFVYHKMVGDVSSFFLTIKINSKYE